MVVVRVAREGTELVIRFHCVQFFLLRGFYLAFNGWRRTVTLILRPYDERVTESREERWSGGGKEAGRCPVKNVLNVLHEDALGHDHFYVASL